MYNQSTYNININLVLKAIPKSMTIELAAKLIERVSITPNDAGCQQLLASRLEQSGFKATHLKFEDVDNLWMTHGTGDPVMCFLGHTDVVPPGPEEEWHSDPFIPKVRDGYMYGRGTADMKGSIAAMVTAFERFIEMYPNHLGTLALLLTSDEEGKAVNGTSKVVEYLTAKDINLRWCIVGEPSSREMTGDIIKNGRRGSLTAHLTVFGIQGHIAYPESAINPIHTVIHALAELCQTVWDSGNEHYPPTTFQISNINAGTGTDNIIPGSAKMQFNFRFSTEVSDQQLIEKVEAMLDRHGVRYEIDWLPSSNPFLTTGGKLLAVVKKVICDITGVSPEITTNGGTSDGRFIAPTGAEVIELGPVNQTIHKVNECVKVTDIETLSTIYETVIRTLLTKQ